MKKRNIIFRIFMIVGVIVTLISDSDVQMALAPLAIPIIMAAVSGASSIAGGIMSARENRKNQSLVNQRNAELTKDLYQGVLDDPGSQAYLRTLNNNLRDTIQGIENTSVSTGSTHENTLAQKEAANEVTANAMGDLLRREDDKKFALLGRRDAIDQQQMAINTQRAQSWSQIAQGVANSANALGSAYMLGEQKLFGTNPTTVDMTNYGNTLAQEGLNKTIEQQVRGWTPKGLTN